FAYCAARRTPKQLGVGSGFSRIADRGSLKLMAATVNVNGRVFDQEHAVISVFDHGFLYGEGVYETWRTYNGPPVLFERHMTVARVQFIRIYPGTVSPLIKSINLLNNALAMQEAFRRGAFEGVMRNYRGELAECTQSNLFIVKDGAALAPPLDAGLLPGITREFLFEVGAEHGIPVREAVLRDDDLLGADEAFLTSTTREVVPIVRVDDRTIGSGVPGRITLELLRRFREKADRLTRAVAHDRSNRPH